MTAPQPPAPAGQLSALTGIRFFAVFHIFLFHLWSLYDLKNKPEQFKALLSGYADLPPLLVRYLSNGWMSTSFFFLLSGFILAYLYWGPDGQLVGTKKAFWCKRFARIYPVHVLILLVTFVLMGGYYAANGGLSPKAIWSALATFTLVQAWYPPLVPVWSWPTWTLSAVVFLYALTPWLMAQLGKLSPRNQLTLLAILPPISLLPTVIYAQFFPSGATPELNWQIFIGSTPLFWVPHFAAGMLLSRVSGITRYNSTWQTHKPSWLAWGDLALLAVIVIACLPGMGEEPFKFFLRHGLVMPLYMLLILDLAKGRGLAAKIFALPGMRQLGEASFSIFIWQNLVMVFCWGTAAMAPEVGHYQVYGAALIMVVLALASTHWLEKPIAARLRLSWLKSSN